MKVKEQDRQKMVRLYALGKGTDTIAHKLGFGKTTVRRHLLSAGVKFRFAPKDVISVAKHSEFVKLYKQGFSIKRIAEMRQSIFATVQRHIHKEGIKVRGRGDPHLIAPEYIKLTPEKAYVLGVVGPGDGFLDLKKIGDGGSIALEAADLDFVELFASYLERVYGILPRVKQLKPRPGDVKIHYKTRLHSIAACRDIFSYGVPTKERIWRIPQVIKNAPEALKVKYIQGFADSQGCVANFKTCKAIILCSKNQEGVKEIGKLLSDLGVKWNFCKQGIRIGARRNIETFAKKVNFLMQRKRKALAELLDSYQVWKTPSKDIDKSVPNMLKLQKQGQTYSNIARQLDLPIGTVWGRLKRIENISTNIK